MKNEQNIAALQIFINIVTSEMGFFSQLHVKAILIWPVSLA